MNPEEFGAFVRKRRKELKLTQKDLADKIGLSRQTIIQIEKGRIASLSYAKMWALVRTLGYEIKLSKWNPFERYSLFCDEE